MTRHQLLRARFSGRTLGLLLSLGLLTAPAGAAVAEGVRPSGERLAGSVEPAAVAGVRVLGGGLLTLRGTSGLPRWTKDLRWVPPVGETPSWRIGAAEAVRIALGAEPPGIRGPGAPALGGERAVPAVLPLGETGVPLWIVHLPPLLPLVYNPVFYVEARHGRVLHQENRVWTAGRVKVFRGNPIATPEPVEVELSNLDSREPGSHLVGPLVRSFNCPDRHELFDVNYLGARAEVHLCSEVHLAKADAQGDFLYDETSPNEAEDLFAESHMFYHVNYAYDRFRAFGFDTLRQVPLRAVVNFRIPDVLGAFSPDGELQPFDNAFFLPAADLAGVIVRDEDSIVFGQGTRVDFAYDADVIYHEFTHAVVDTEARLWMTALDQWGVSVAPGSLHEGYADFFAATFTGDPAVGEYAGSGLLEEGGPIRDISGEATCPGSLIGEVHEDGLPWSGALWEIRSLLLADGVASDDIAAAVFAGIQALPEDAGYEIATEVTLAALAASLGEPVAARAREVFARRGVLDCARILPVTSKPLMYLPGKSAWNLENYVPGVFQFRLTPELAHGRAVVEFLLPAPGLALLGGGEAKPLLLVKAGEEPLVMTYRLVDGDPRTLPNADRMAVVEDLDAGSGRYPHRMRGVVRFTPGQQTVHVMIANRGDGEAYLEDIVLRTEEDPDNPWIPPEDAGAADVGVRDGGAGGDAGGLTDAGPAADVEEPVDEGGTSRDTGTGRADGGTLDQGAAPADQGSDAGGPPVDPDADDDAADGCSCRLPAGDPSAGARWGLLGLVLLGLGRARSR